MINGKADEWSELVESFLQSKHVVKYWKTELLRCECHSTSKSTLSLYKTIIAKRRHDPKTTHPKTISLVDMVRPILTQAKPQQLAPGFLVVKDDLEGTLTD